MTAAAATISDAELPGARFLPRGGTALVVRLSALGDVLFALETVAALRRERPDVAVDFLVEDRFRGLLDGHPHLREVIIKTLPMLLGLGVFQLNTFVDSLVASWQTMVGPTIMGVPYPLPEGSLTYLSYAQRLYEFPLGVFGVATATAIFPALAREANAPDRFMETLRRGIRLSFFIGFPASVGLLAVIR